MMNLGLFTMRIFSGFLGILPFFVIYGLSDITSIVLQYVIGYRRRVVKKNLQKCFPHKSDSELKTIERKFYKNLSDITIESIKGLYMSKEQLAKRFKVINPEVLDQYYENNQDILNLAGHYANWEWGILAVDFQIKHQAASIYKPMHNKKMEAYTYKKRTRFGMDLVPITQTKEYFAAPKTKPASYILAADQHPKDTKKSIVVKFFNMDTACLHGPEAYGRKTGMPIVYFDIQRIKRGYYTMEIKEMFKNPKETDFGEITQKYMVTLENIIKKQPENWLWSHKRWKYSEKEVAEIKKHNLSIIEQEQKGTKTS